MIYISPVLDKKDNIRLYGVYFFSYFAFFVSVKFILYISDIYKSTSGLGNQWL